MKKQTLVLGLGNPLMSDEGIGNHLIERLSKLAEKYPCVDFVDAGTGGLKILHLFEGRSKVIIIDCANMGTEPGCIKKFPPDQVSSVKKMSHYSLHEQDLLQIINLAKKLDQCQQEIVIFGIQPESSCFGQKLSKKLMDRMNDYIKFICTELV
jgi:hydrogenase maturation protease